MAQLKVVLQFPPNLIEQPITYQLIKKHDLMVNILGARITPKEQGRLVVEISGKKKNLDAALRFLKEIGVGVEPLARDVTWHEDRCIECTACTSICPTGALSVSRPEMRVTFNHGKCIACELCVPVCPYKAMEIVSK
ncbi:MAG: 4Fe-4S dicluster domain-containing protein [Deltaproteobacteria bacterium]|jgi:ferredoxin|nr:4Fe-4S dicluster domain-containing protein [Deltaproteobacteria bacterium]